MADIDTIKVPIVAPPYPTLEGIELELNSISIKDAYIDEAGYMVKRPGLEEAVDLGTNSDIDGLDYWDDLDLLIAVSDGKCFKIDSSLTVTQIGTTLQLDNKPSVAFTILNGQRYMAIANGARIYISIEGGALAPVTDINAPTTVNSVVFSTTRLVANDIGTDVFKWSDTEDPFTWSATSFASAEGEPDDITALRKSWNEILLFGTQTLEFWFTTPDATTPFVRMQGTQLNQGTLSPDTITLDEETSIWYFLDSNRNLSALAHRQTTVISNAIAQQLKDISDVTTARMEIVRFSSHKFLVLSFPSDNITYVHDITTGNWFQWGKYRTDINEYDIFLGRSLVWANKRGINFAGSAKTDGKVFTFSPSIYTDDTETIRPALESGWISTGEHLLKRWIMLRCRLKLQPNPGTSFILLFQKDDEAFSSVERTADIDIDVGPLAQKSFVQRFRNFGTARAVKFEIYCTDNIPFIIGGFELDYVRQRF